MPKLCCITVTNNEGVEPHYRNCQTGLQCVMSCVCLLKLSVCLSVTAHYDCGFMHLPIICSFICHSCRVNVSVNCLDSVHPSSPSHKGHLFSFFIALKLLTSSSPLFMSCLFFYPSLHVLLLIYYLLIQKLSLLTF